jgi:Cys-rich repeat protein
VRFIDNHRVTHSVIISLALAAAACRQTQSQKCMKMGVAQSDLYKEAALFRVDVYGASASCNAGMVANGGAPPTFTRTFQPGQAITIDIAPGRHAVSANAFSDSAGSVLIATSCVEVTLSAGARPCFDLTLVAVSNDMQPPSLCDGAACSCASDGDCTDAATPRCGPDHVCVPCLAVADNCPSGQYCRSDLICAAGCKSTTDCAVASKDGGTIGSLCDLTQHRCVQCLSSADCAAGKVCAATGECLDSCSAGPGACAGNLMCCSALCVDAQTSLANCGGCGRSCSSTHVGTPSCGKGLCTSTCLSGFGNCAQPAWPADDDGCETDLKGNSDNCGACTHGCTTQQASGTSCSGGQCKPVCISGWADCSTPAPPNNDNGCETHTDVLITDCGGCGRACSTNNTMGPLSCSQGLCKPTGCAPGYGDCGQPAAPTKDDGCEAMLNTPLHCGSCANACPAGRQCCGTNCEITHTNGLGQQFFDCAALDTHDVTEAMAAAHAWMSGGTVFDANPSPCADGSGMVCNQQSNSCACWAYVAGGTSAVAGHVFLNAASTGCRCPGIGDGTWH